MYSNTLPDSATTTGCSQMSGGISEQEGHACYIDACYSACTIQKQKQQQQWYACQMVLMTRHMTVSHIRAKHVGLLQHCRTVADFMSFCEPNACGA